ncbi:hypothetical protein BD309DRAFT_947827 [Dichomitus squalens]|nr:hypothetical protein BD309DRAFT_947827 [Dichomitus squalens]
MGPGPSSLPELELEAEVRRGGVRERLVFIVVSLSVSICGPGRRGVALPESLSVDILSRSLSESSPFPLELYRRVKEVMSGLWRRLSGGGLLPLLGLSRLGRRSRSRKGLRSSEALGGKEADGEDGNAKSDEDVGREGRMIGRCTEGRSR